MKTLHVTCVRCHERFAPTNKRGPLPSYCSSRCKQLANHPPAPRVKGRCKRCGKSFVGIARRRFCSATCAALRWKACLGCGRKKWINHQNACCSKACGHRAIAKRLAGETRTCGRCLQPFTPHRLDQLYCSIGCQNRNDCNRKRHRRRAAYAEDVTIAYLMERDGGQCGVCGKPIDITIEHPDPMSASLDHIVPVSKGGTHARSNCQPAHLGCNSRKHNKVMGQSLTIG